MGALVLACGNPGPLGLAEGDGARTVALPAPPARAEVDPLVKGLSGDRLVVHGTDADLAAVVLRLMRLSRLDVPVGFVPVGRSAVATLWGLPTDPAAALRTALAADVDPLPLVRDDAGGVLLGLGVLRSVRGVAYCDDATALRGRAGRIEVRPDAARGLVVDVVRYGLLGKSVETLRGRAFQVGCLPTIPVSDGVAHPRDVTKWTWYRHTEDLRLARGLI